MDCRIIFICIAILYPNVKCGIASGNSQQARNVIIQKIKGELSKNETIARESIFPLKLVLMIAIVNLRTDLKFERLRWHKIAEETQRDPGASIIYWLMKHV